MNTDEFKKLAKQSAKTRLEDRFLEAFAAVKPAGVPMPEREFRFHPARKWRFDFAFPQIKLAVEIHGGSYIRGRHNTAGGQAGDCDKRNEAARLGWTLLEFSTVHLKDPTACAAYVVDVMADLSEVPLVRHETPWSKRADELLATEGHYADYVAWEEWMRQKLSVFYPPESCWAPLEAFEDLMIAERVPLYSLMVELTCPECNKLTSLAFNSRD